MNEEKMRKFLTLTLGIAALAIVFSAKAEPVSIPEKVAADILKRHPKAHELQASHEKHFGVELLEVVFKEEKDEPYLELFTHDGHLFANELLIEDLSEVSPAVIEVVKQHFPKYELKKAELIANPNGVGEEYEIYLVADGANWKVSINGQGGIEGKERY
ncbi:MAG: hypothetical protein M0Q44_15730 [Methylobacter sp.]|jgi:hypothetical protein|nr:hypothetical protein [Methylobacter sp.]